MTKLGKALEAEVNRKKKELGVKDWMLNAAVEISQGKDMTALDMAGIIARHWRK